MSEFVGIGDLYQFARMMSNVALESCADLFRGSCIPLLSDQYAHFRIPTRCRRIYEDDGQGQAMSDLLARPVTLRGLLLGKVLF